MTTMTQIKPVYREVFSCCPGYIETATDNCTEGRDTTRNIVVGNSDKWFEY